MRVEMLKTMKGDQLWKRGMIFDDTISPIPRDVLAEVTQGAKTVKVLFLEPPKTAPEDLTSPEAVTEDTIVTAETANVSFLTPEYPTKHLPELEGLILAKGTIAAVASLLNVTYVTVGRWRKGSVPKPEMLEKIKKEYELMRRGHDQERIDHIASAGTQRSDN